MTDKIHKLKWHRTSANVLQQDLAALLQMAPANLIRYENGLRNPTPELILTYHILFKASLQQLFPSLYSKVTQNLIQRSTGLIDRLKNNPSSKSNYRLSYLEQFVKELSTQQNDE